MTVGKLIWRVFISVLLLALIGALTYGGIYWDYRLRSNPSKVLVGVPKTGVVLTGDMRRVRFALDMMEEGQLDRLFIIGQGVDPLQLTKQFKLTPKLKATLERGDIVISNESISTLENGIEALCRLKAHTEIDAMTLITSGYHMARASLILDRALPADLKVIRVASDQPHDLQPSRFQKSEWPKFFASWFITLAPQPVWVTGSIKPCTGNWIERFFVRS